MVENEKNKVISTGKNWTLISIEELKAKEKGTISISAPEGGGRG